MVTETLAPARARAVPWFVWCAALAVTSSVLGVHWDISWHRSIGRDQFLTPPHLAIYLAGILGGLFSGWLILSTTLRGSPADKQAAVGMWGFRGPLGAFLTAWGGVAMLTSAPFDDWWHSTYGLDVKIVSPPHAVLGLGILCIQAGALLLVLGHLNRAEAEARAPLHRLFLFVGALILVFLLVFSMEYTYNATQHTASFYRVVALAVPPVLVGVARAAGGRWAATTLALIYTAVLLALLWILPLFPAEPKLGPVYHLVTHFVPPPFPLLLIAPALALDLLWARTDGWRPGRLALGSGALFFVVFLAVQWPFAGFLQTPAARNAVFGADYFDYATPHSSFEYRHLLFRHRSRATLVVGLAEALAISVVTTRIGLAWGDWMRRIRR
jgi:hypothetical protein